VSLCDSASVLLLTTMGGVEYVGCYGAMLAARVLASSTFNTKAVWRTMEGRCRGCAVTEQRDAEANTRAERERRREERGPATIW